jgi:serine/threonine-protein phosphatase PGAM5
MKPHRLIFVRHGQYDEVETGDLTPLGREQAARTSAALSWVAASTIYTSTLPRARQTAAIVAQRLPGVPLVALRSLCEGIPTPIAVYVPAAHIRADKARLDGAFRRLFRPTRESRTDIVVCHGNVIRYFVCRALRLPERTWVRLESIHCGLTELVVHPSGAMRLRSYNDTGHLPPRLRTMSFAATKQD